MEGETVGGDVLLRTLKPKLIDILTADPDLVLQHADSLRLLTRRQYTQVKSITNPSHMVRDLLDYVIRNGRPTSCSFLHLLQEKEIQETFPRLGFLNDLKWIKSEKTTVKCGTKRQLVAAEEIPLKMLCTDTVVTEKQLMLVASKMGRCWKQFGRVALGIESVKLEQISEDNPCNLVEQVFAMLRVWSMRERSKATTTRLHHLLSEGDWALPPENIHFLLDGS